MNISNLGRLLGAGVLALGLHAFAPSTTAQALSGGPADAGTTNTEGVVGQTRLNPARAAEHSTRSPG
jgi:hypothetical protein